MPVVENLPKPRLKPKKGVSAISIANLRPQIAGQPSINPGGRPKGVAAYIREQTSDGKELVDFALKVLRGELTYMRPNLAGDGEVEATATVTERQRSMEWLADRGFGKVSLDVDGVNSRLVLVNLFFNQSDKRVETPQPVDVESEPIVETNLT